MRLAILSDVHGNLPALETVLDDVRQHGVDGLLVAGDLVGGPQPNETTTLLRALDAQMIRGNSDTAVLQYANGLAPASRYTHLQFAMLRWTCTNLHPKTLSTLRSLPEQRVIAMPGTAAIRIVHGSPQDPAGSIYPGRDPASLELALDQTEEPLLVCGHTHEPWQVRRGGRLALNPGAVCGPLDGFVGTQYALLTWADSCWQAELRRLRYDLDLVRAALHDSGLLQQGGALARLLMMCLETGHNPWQEFLAYAWGLADVSGCGDGDAIPNAIWQRAEAAFDWEAWRVTGHS
jgi:putative phosphoesterase